MNQDDLLRHIHEMHDEHARLSFARYRMYAAFWFHEYDIFVEIMKSVDAQHFYYEKANPAHLGLCPLYFHCALSCIAVARKTKRQKYRRYARSFYRKIQGWAKKGTPNWVHCEALVEAELASLVPSQKHVAANKYVVAVLMAGRRGLTHDQALAHELFANHCLRMGNETDARHHYIKAIELYGDWGAAAMVDMLSKCYADLLGPVEEVSFRDGAIGSSELMVPGV